MKKLVGIFLMILLMGVAAYAMADVAIDATNFPDDSFRDYITESFDTNKNGSLSDDEIKEIAYVSCSNMHIHSLMGIEKLPHVIWLDCADNKITELDVSSNQMLEYLNCSSNKLTKLNVSKNIKLRELSCAHNGITTVDLKNNELLVYLYVNGNGITELNTSNLTQLGSFDCSDNNLSTLNITNNTLLSYLACSKNKINSLNLSKQSELIELYCSNNQLKSLNLTENKKIRMLQVGGNQLSSIDLSNCTQLVSLTVSYNQLTSLNIQNCTKLVDLWCEYNQLTTLDLSNNTNLEELYCGYNNMNTLDLTPLTYLERVDCQSGHIKNLILLNPDLYILESQGNDFCVLDICQCPILVNSIKKRGIPNGMMNGDYCAWGDEKTNICVSHGITLIVDDTTRIICHELQKHDRVEPTLFKEGTEEYWHCLVCNKFYSDSEGKNEIAAPIVIPKVQDDNLIEAEKCGYDEVYYTLDKNGLLTIFGTGEIQNNAFENRQDIKRVVIKEGITRIGGNAFSYCDQMTEISIPESVTSLGISAIYHCNSLESLTIPGSIKDVGISSISHCAALKRLELCEGVTFINQWDFTGCFELTDIVLPNTLKKIDYGAFQSCYSLGSLMIPDSVTDISSWAFSLCDGLSTIIVPTCNSYAHNWAREKGYLVNAMKHQNVVSRSGETYCTVCGDYIPDEPYPTDAYSYGKIKAFVVRCYNIILGRMPDSEGMDTWTEELNSGRKAAAEIIEQFVASAEFQSKNLSNADAVEILYKAMLGRGSDPSGKADWLAKLNAGQHITAVINGFCGSAEFKAICDSYGIQPGTVTVKDGTPVTPGADNEKIKAYVERCYQIILGRGADEGGLNTWMDELTSGRKAAAEIIEQFVASAEFQNKKLSNSDSVEILYKAMLGRGSDPAGKASWVEKLDAGQDLTAVINGFCGSAEFKAICDSYGIQPGTVTVKQPTAPAANDEKIQAFVARCYKIILGRDADEGGMSTWFNELKSGRKAAAEIIESFVNSQEFKNKNYSNADAVEILYKAMLGRGSDPAGKADWVEKLNAGQPLEAVINGFCGSAEFKAICDAYGITPGTVNVPQLSKMAVMEEVPAEKPVVKETVNNVTRVEITNASDTVNENLGTAVQAIYINEEKAKEFIGRCYQAILCREASQAELDSWIGQMMNGGKTADQVARGFLFSGEFKGRNIGNEELVKILYRVYMNREADPEGLGTWTKKLDEGTGLNDLLDAFAKTNEFKAVLKDMAQ